MGALFEVLTWVFVALFGTLAVCSIILIITFIHESVTLTKSHKDMKDRWDPPEPTDEEWADSEVMIWGDDVWSTQWQCIHCHRIFPDEDGWNSKKAHLTYHHRKYITGPEDGRPWKI